MVSMTAAPAMPTRFTVRSARIALTTFGAVVALVGLSGITTAPITGGRAFGAIMLAAGLLYAVRGNMSSVVVLTDEGLRLQAIQRTRRIPWSAMRSAHMELGKVGLMAYRREVLVLDLADGTTFTFKDLNSRPACGDETTVVAAAVAAINAVALRRR